MRTTYVRATERALALFVACGLTGGAAWAQADGPVPGEGATKAAVAPVLGESDGRKVIQFPNGYARYVPDAEAAGVEGGVSVVPAPQAPPKAPAPEQAPPQAQEEGSGAIPPPPSDPCLLEEQLLAKRLLELRGVYVDRESALLAWSSAEWPLAPSITMPMFGRPVAPVGGPFLVNALSWDMTTQNLTSALTACLNGHQ